MLKLAKTVLSKKLLIIVKLFLKKIVCKQKQAIIQDSLLNFLVTFLCLYDTDHSNIHRSHQTMATWHGQALGYRSHYHQGNSIKWSLRLPFQSPVLLLSCLREILSIRSSIACVQTILLLPKPEF